MEIVIASKNLHKIREIRSILGSSGKIDLLSLIQFPDYLPPEESGSTFEENASLKAIHAAKALGKWVIADDSGLVVPSLGGRPGVFSKRYGGPNATDFDNRKKLLEEMRDIKEADKRSAFFMAAIAFASPEKLIKCVTASCEGRILEAERGRNGFGYDSIFVKNDYDKSFAELDEMTKNRISHRGKALEKMNVYLERFLKDAASL